MELTFELPRGCSQGVVDAPDKVYLYLGLKVEGDGDVYESWWQGWVTLRSCGDGDNLMLCDVPVNLTASEVNRAVIEEQPEYDPPRNGGPAIMRAMLTIKQDVGPSTPKQHKHRCQREEDEGEHKAPKKAKASSAYQPCYF